MELEQPAPKQPVSKTSGYVPAGYVNTTKLEQERWDDSSASEGLSDRD